MEKTNKRRSRPQAARSLNDCRHLIAKPAMIAAIVKECLPEFADIPQSGIIKKYMKGRPQEILWPYVSSQKDCRFYYDIVFRLKLPETGTIVPCGIILNLLDAEVCSHFADHHSLWRLAGLKEQGQDGRMEESVSIMIGFGSGESESRMCTGLQFEKSSLPDQPFNSLHREYQIIIEPQSSSSLFSLLFLSMPDSDLYPAPAKLCRHAAKHHKEGPYVSRSDVRLLMNFMQISLQEALSLLKVPVREQKYYQRLQN